MKPFAKNGANGFLHELLDARLQTCHDLFGQGVQVLAVLQPAL